MDLLKAPRFPYQKRIQNEGQRTFRTKERANNISLFKSNSENCNCQLRQLTGSIPSSIFLDPSWIYCCQVRQSTQCEVVVEATGASTLKVFGILSAIKATVDRNVNSHCWQDFTSSESYNQYEFQLPLLTGFWLRWQLR